jgi:acetyltransferase
MKNLDLLFKPRNVAIYEAKEKLSYFIMGFKTQNYNMDNMYLISPTEEEILGIKCYKSLADVPTETIDLLILSVRREILIESLKMLLTEKKINFIHIFTAGTGEFDEVGGKIERETKEFLDNQENTMAIGPNCMGVYCPAGNSAYLPRFPSKPGKIGLIFHSGDLTSRTIMYGDSRYNLTFSKGASIGNCINLQVTDFLEYFENDNDTEIIAIYFEGFSKYQKNGGRKLFNLLKKTKKPVLFLRGGMTTRGKKAVSSHTGSLGTSDRIWNAVYEQTALIEVGSSLDELVDYLYIFSKFFEQKGDITFDERIKYFPRGKNVLVILWSGGLGILDTDTLTKLGLNLPVYDGESLKKLKEIYPIRVGSLSNPLDLPWVSRTGRYVDLCKAAITEKIDVVIMHTNAWGMRDPERFKLYYNNLNQIRAHIEAQNKLLILILAEAPHKIREDYYWKLINDGFIVFSNLTRAAKSFLSLYNYGQQIRKLHTR